MLLPSTRVLALALSLACMPHAGLAANVTRAVLDSSTALLEEVVVTASRIPERLLETGASVSVLNREELARMQPLGVADLLRDLPGVQVSDSGQAGLKRIRIRGEDSRRSAILVDGHELSDHSEVGTPLTIHPEMLARVEMIRGSGSVLYGSRALSGVTNLLTLQGGKQPLQATLRASHDSATRGGSTFASLHGSSRGWSWRIAGAEGNYRERRSPDGPVENTTFDNRGHYAYLEKAGDQHLLALTWDRYDSRADVFVEEEARSTFPLVDFALDTPERDRERFALDWQWEIERGPLRQLSVSAFTQDSDRTFLSYTRTIWYQRDIRTLGQLTTDGLLLQADWQPASSHQLITGLQYVEDRVRQQRDVNTLSWSPVAISGEERIRDRASIRTLAAFAQDHWQMTDNWTLVAGMRYYQVEGELADSNRPGLPRDRLDRDNHGIASLGLNWSATANSLWRVHIAQGYLYPSLSQLATGAYAGSRYVNPNDALEPETSVNLELGWRYQDRQWTVDAAVFGTRSRDYIDHVFCTDTDACLSPEDKYYRNIGESRAHGMEALISWQSSALPIRPYANLTWMQRENDFGDLSTWESGIPSLSGRAGVEYEPHVRGVPVWFDLFLRGENGSRLTEPGSRGILRSEKSGWLTVNLAAGVTLPWMEGLKLALEVYNLTDRRYRESTENLLAAGRGASVSLQWDW